MRKDILTTSIIAVIVVGVFVYLYYFNKNSDTNNVGKIQNLNIRMTYTPDSEVKFSIDERENKNELELTVNLKNNSTSNIKINGVLSEETKNVIKECLIKLLKTSYENQIPKQNDVLTLQKIIIEYKDEDGRNPLIWLAE